MPYEVIPKQTEIHRVILSDTMDADTWWECRTATYDDLDQSLYHLRVMEERLEQEQQEGTTAVVAVRTSMNSTLATARIHSFVTLEGSNIMWTPEGADEPKPLFVKGMEMQAFWDAWSLLHPDQRWEIYSGVLRQNTEWDPKVPRTRPTV